MEEIFYPSHDGVTTIHACIFRPQGEIKAAVQIIHGMAEYAERYSPFAEFLASNGYLVFAEDHLGHGKSVVSENDYGYFNAKHDVKIVISDIRALYEKVKDEIGAGIPFFVLGHSMGSFYCRKYIQEYGKCFSGAIIMGSGYKSQATLNFALFFCKLNALFCGWRNKSKLIDKLAFGSYNKKFAPNRTDFDWLSKSGENVDAYIKDKLCGIPFTTNGFYCLFKIIKQACKSSTFKNTPKNLPLLFLSGDMDPVGDYGKGVKKSYKKYVKAGVEQVDIKLYPELRHEILNDECKNQVYKDALSFFENHIK